MEFTKASNLYSLNKNTYVNLRWIAYIGQITAILIVQFYLKYEFKYFTCISIIFFSILSNLYLQLKIIDNQLKNFENDMKVFSFKIKANKFPSIFGVNNNLLLQSFMK